MQVVDDILKTGMGTNFLHNLFSSNCKKGMSIKEQLTAKIISD
jgi:hypothetical protein